jgi:hypothetical protein
MLFDYFLAFFFPVWRPGTATAQDTRRAIREASMPNLITRTTTIGNSRTRNEAQAEERRDSVSPDVWNGRVLDNWGTFFAVPDDPKSATDCGEPPT